eukprot:GHVQ01006678.1.p1 GENE.GHVQ01006678.1~~GHVQ01006678.1.p1  ORF type:complete len:158 (-),score=16.94 GHVQ01006678.1:255-728(-)
MTTCSICIHPPPPSPPVQVKEAHGVSPVAYKPQLEQRVILPSLKSKKPRKPRNPEWTIGLLFAVLIQSAFSLSPFITPVAAGRTGLSDAVDCLSKPYEIFTIIGRIAIVVGLCYILVIWTALHSLGGMSASVRGKREEIDNETNSLCRSSRVSTDKH